jgi:hypothetical protein
MACFGVLGVLLLPLALSAQTPDQQAPEGYDPMIQITHQFVKPNVYILLSTSSPMNNDAAGNDVGNASQGEAPQLSWSVRPKSTGKDAYDPGCDGTGKCLRWTYILTNTQKWPGRMNMVKNALGKHVDIWTTWDPPNPWPNPNIDFPLAWRTGTIATPAPTVVHTSTTHSYSWMVTYATPQPDPGIPFGAYDTFGKPTIGSGGVFLPAQDLVGKTAKMVNWGLITFKGQSCDPTSSTWSTDVVVDSTDSGNVDALESNLKPQSGGGTPVGGVTNLKPAITYSQLALQAAFDADPKKACGRTYATLLVDGALSNNCNPSDGDWISPCRECPACCDPKSIGSSGYDCPTNYSAFGAGSSEGAWNSVHGALTRLRTFVIGVSQQVLPCEMNMVAYMGRTDASAPNGDAGMGLDKTTFVPKDPRLPQSTGDMSRYHPESGNYAFFANDPNGLKNAFLSIVAAVAAGDYTTSAPVASSALSTASVTTTAAIITTAEFPGWKGHAWSYNLSKPSTDPDYIMWDAGWNLAHSTLPVDKTASPWEAGTTANPAYVAPGSRKIYTWDPSNGNALVPIATDATTVAKLNTLCGSCGITSATADFMMGNDGSGTIRSWVLGSIVNSAPAITQTPESFLQGTLENHKAFEDQSQSPGNRTPLVWVGADDDMLHAFQLSDGKEVLAIIPPNLLKNQVALYANYLADPVKQSTGQPTGPQDHIYGFSGSVRYGDMYDTAIPGYRTVMLLTEGPGGKGIAGIDATDPVAKLSASQDPFKVLWYKRGGADWSNLHTTWSTPAGGPVSPSSTPSTHSKWRSLVGSGFNLASTALATTACPTPPCQKTPYAMAFDPITGDLKKGDLVPSTPTVSSPAPWVGNQAFADSVLYQMSASAYYADNIVDLGLQADLNGRIWFLPVSGTGDITSCAVGIDATAKALQQQPIYYAPAVNGYTSGGSSYDLYVFGSGTLYEKSPKVTGADVGKTGYFLPSLYLVAKAQDITAATNTQIAQIPINLLYKPDDLTNTSTDPANPSPCSLAANQAIYTPYNQLLCKLNDPHSKLGPRTQLTAPAALFVPVSNASANPIVLFLLYDPDDQSSCAGISYVVKIAFGIDGATGSPTVKQTQLYNAGEGAASGFAIAGNSVIVAKSAVGEGKRASFNTVPGVNPTTGMSNPTPIWWRELK